MAEIKEVATPITVATVSSRLDTSSRVNTLISSYTPAVTMVAAWSSADTGVGRSIASGSQVCSRSWADLAVIATSIRHPI